MSAVSKIVPRQVNGVAVQPPKHRRPQRATGMRALANGQQCTLRIPGACNGDPATTVLAHLACGHRGTGIKGPDSIAVFACSGCHECIDLLLTSGAADPRDITRALAETHAVAIRAGVMEVR